MREEPFQTSIIEYAELISWLVYHTRDSRGSHPGFPDLVLVRGDRIVYVELKGDGGRVSPDQRRWLTALEAAGAEVYVWWPQDFNDAVSILTQRNRPVREAVAA